MCCGETHKPSGSVRPEVGLQDEFHVTFIPLLFVLLVLGGWTAGGFLPRNSRTRRLDLSTAPLSVVPAFASWRPTGRRPRVETNPWPPGRGGLNPWGAEGPHPRPHRT